MGSTLRGGPASTGRQTDLPAPVGRLVVRPRLTAMLAAEVPLTLVVGPAGSGKTVAVATWAAQVPGPVGWVTLDAADLVGAAPWVPIVAALRRTGVRVPALVSLGDGAAGGAAFSTMLGAHVAAHPEPVVLVLDVGGAVPADLAEGLERVLRQAPGRLRLVIVSRVDPPVPVHRYRLEGAVTELDATDLAFRPEEVGALLDHARLTLSADGARALHARTRGWVAGVRLAMLDAERSGGGSWAGEVSAASGSVAAYLRAEVLDQIAPAERRLLLDCSVADDLPTGLVGALGGSVRALERLGKAFVEESPGRPGSFVLAPLARELYYAQLVAEDPERARVLHRRAGEWLAGEGRWSDAASQAARALAWDEVARYAVAGGVVADLVRGHLPAERVAALARVPASTPGVDAAIVRAVALAARGDVTRATAEVAEARPAPDSQVALGLLQVVLASGRGDAAGVVAAADRLGPPMQDRPDVVAAIEALRGDALLVLGRLEAAALAYRGIGSRRGRLALVEALRGELRGARALADRAQSGPGRVDPSGQIASAWASLEGDELDAARAHLRRAGRVPITPADPVPGTLVALLEARLRRASGDLEGARDALAVTPAGSAWLADLLLLEHGALDLAGGRPGSALDRHASVADPTSEGAQRLLWQVRLAEWAGASAHPAPDASLAVRVEGWLLEASRRLSLGERAAARRAVQRALDLAAPEQLRRPFREASVDVRRLLLEEPAAGPSTRPTRRPAQRPELPVDESVRDLVEPLTEKECEVLGHLAAMLSTDEIAAAMFVSVNTVRTHVRNILRKLGASRRNEAVRKARAIHLIPA
ncbi:LuxR C-terminal-related transcriptional regulator [Cellulomonas sp. McL0617]|uniref:LuxR C-terminal-related transcriptional regulator n=1 Tax=Cellulomonas sp. McL0617 TaxID=3415675 RepID=UPI003CF2C6AB